MEPESSLSCSQEPAAGPYPKPDDLFHNVTPYFCKFLLILSSHLHLGLQNGIFPSGFRLKCCVYFLFYLLPATCPTHLILLVGVSWLTLVLRIPEFPSSNLGPETEVRSFPQSVQVNARVVP
jgi:hypothetical protein